MTAGGSRLRSRDQPGNDHGGPMEHYEVLIVGGGNAGISLACLLYTSPSPRDS